MSRGADLTVLSVRVLAFVVGAYFSYKNANGYWVVGPLFGAVVLVWHARSFQDVLMPRSAAFFLCSTLIWMLVFRIVSVEDRFVIAIAVGTTLLPLAHKLTLGASFRRVLLAIPCIFIVWYGLVFPFADHWSNDFVNIVSVWQLLYLIFLFAKIGHGKPQ